jgi:hypothetical protein
MATIPTIGGGTTLSVCAALPPTYDQTGYQSLNYTQIKGVRSVGEIGEQFKTAENNMIGGIPSMRKVGRAASNIGLEVIRITDEGQAILNAAMDATTSYSYKITRADGSALYFTGAASSRKWASITGNSLVGSKMQLEIDSRIIEVD